MGTVRPDRALPIYYDALYLTRFQAAFEYQRPEAEVVQIVHMYVRLSPAEVILHIFVRRVKDDPGIERWRVPEFRIGKVVVPMENVR